jgi:hypothetical protein
MITTAQFPDLTKNAFVQWQEARKEFPSVRSQLAVIKSVTDEKSDHSSLGSVNTARRRYEGKDAHKGTLKQGYTKRFSQTEIAIEMDVTLKMRKFDKYDKINEIVRGAGKGAERRMELDIASLLYNAWASSYVNLDGETVTTTAPDGNTLIYTAHTANGSSATFSNEVSTTHSPFSQDVLEGLEEKFNGFIDDADGRNLPIIPDTIITGRHSPTKHAVKRVLESEYYTENGNMSKNTVANYRHLVVPLLDINPTTEARNSSMQKYCFVAALNSREQNGLRLELSQDISFVPPEQVFESSTWQYLTNAWYDFGILFANFISGTKGTGVAV